MQENRQHTHKIVTQDIPWENLIEGKTQPPKASITMHYLEKIPLQYNHGNLQSHSHHQAIHVNKHESTHPMPCFQPSQMLPWITCQALSNLTLSLFSFYLLTYNNYPCGCLYSSKSHKTTKWYYINHVLPNPLTPHLIFFPNIK